MTSWFLQAAAAYGGFEGNNPFDFPPSARTSRADGPDTANASSDSSTHSSDEPDALSFSSSSSSSSDTSTSSSVSSRRKRTVSPLAYQHNSDEEDVHHGARLISPARAQQQQDLASYLIAQDKIKQRALREARKLALEARRALATGAAPLPDSPTSSPPRNTAHAPTSHSTTSARVAPSRRTAVAPSRSAARSGTLSSAPYPRRSDSHPASATSVPDRPNRSRSTNLDVPRQTRSRSKSPSPANNEQSDTMDEGTSVSPPASRPDLVLEKEDDEEDGDESYNPSSGRSKKATSTIRKARTVSPPSSLSDVDPSTSGTARPARKRAPPLMDAYGNVVKRAVGRPRKVSPPADSSAKTEALPMVRAATTGSVPPAIRALPSLHVVLKGIRSTAPALPSPLSHSFTSPLEMTSSPEKPSISVAASA